MRVSNSCVLSNNMVNTQIPNHLACTHFQVKKDGVNSNREKSQEGPFLTGISDGSQRQDLEKAQMQLEFGYVSLTSILNSFS